MVVSKSRYLASRTFSHSAISFLSDAICEKSAQFDEQDAFVIRYIFLPS